MKEIFEYRVKLSSIKPDNDSLVKVFGHDLLVESESIINQFVSVEAKGALVIIEPQESVFEFGEKISKVFSKANKIALFVTTLGEESKQIIYSNKSDPFAYYLVDFLASQYAEAMAEFMHERAKEKAIKMSYRFSNRYSPGYCGWNVREQQKLFSYFPENQCGIRLTESSLMDPVKSVSGAIAFGSEVKYREYGCKICNETNCLYKSKL